MLAALLATKPALNDATYQSRRTALQLALLYGSPQIVDMLLAAGADPNQAGDEGRKPLEFLLDRDFEFAVRMTYLPRLVDRPDMARMVQALLKAGAQRPFQGLDDAAGRRERADRRCRRTQAHGGFPELESAGRTDRGRRRCGPSPPPARARPSTTN